MLYFLILLPEANMFAFIFNEFQLPSFAPFLGRILFSSVVVELAFQVRILPGLCISAFVPARSLYLSASGKKVFEGSALSPWAGAWKYQITPN